MYDIRQFKPILYVLVMLGITGFALAAPAPAMFVLAAGAVALNAWLVKTGRFTPMPRLVANGITLLAFLYVARLVTSMPTTPIIIIGQFLVLLQIVKLYEQRANRDYAQLLVLSLLLMVAASITTASLIFGLLLIAYLFLSLYCCLLFHLKVETDNARAAYALPEDQVNPAVLRQDQRYLSRSMRRLTALVSAVAIATAVVVFLVFPRGTGANLLGPLQARASQNLTGFSDQMGFQQVAKITQNTEIVAFVSAWKDDVPMRGGAPIYLRGVTLDKYEGDAGDGTRWQWTRTSARPNAAFGSGGAGLGGFPFARGGQGGTVDVGEAFDLRRPVPPGAPVYRQEITLRPTGTATLFAMPFPTRFTPRERPVTLRYVRRDDMLVATEPLVREQQYEVISVDAQVPLGMQQMMTAFAGPSPDNASRIDPRIVAYLDRIDLADLRARRAGGTGAGGGAVLDPKAGWTPHPLDEELARAIEKHLQTQFQYTLDLTDAGGAGDDDPMVKFLYDFKRGHCEYFAGAMTLLCQSLNVRSRVVIGFKCDEFNPMLDRYTVRQSHAHAWVEVLTPNGWKAFDPTSGREVQGSAARTLAQRVRGLFNFLEFKWANSVIAYDNENRESLIANVNNQLGSTANSSSAAASDFFRWVQGQFGNFATWVIGPIMFLLMGGLVFAVAWFAYERWRLRRRAARIGIDALPATDQLRLVRQLGFYDDLLRLLERHDMIRPPHQTPKEFADGLSFLPSETYDSVRRLTEIFYKIRFGHAKLTPPQRRRLHAVLTRVAESLGPREG